MYVKKKDNYNSLGFIQQTVTTFISSFNEPPKDNETGSQHKPESFQKDTKTQDIALVSLLYLFSSQWAKFFSISYIYFQQVQEG